VFSGEDVIRIYKYLSGNNVQVWLTGGWGIDALLGEQTRPHKDLDIIMLLEDVRRMCQLLEPEGFQLKEIWAENRWVFDTLGNNSATAFVLGDKQDRELDVHAITLDDRGNGIPAWERDEGDIFTQQDLSALGTIAGFAVKCITPEKQVFCHMGYQLPDKQLQDLGLLRAKYGVEISH
jgi:lincosamide nucleotidyltransferase A/C/D/E